MTILGYSCCLQSLLYTKIHCFTFKALIFCIESLSKKGASDNSSEDINIESVSMNFKSLDP
jgi:hypothetical protein